MFNSFGKLQKFSRASRLTIYGLSKTDFAFNTVARFTICRQLKIRFALRTSALYARLMHMRTSHSATRL